MDNFKKELQALLLKYPEVSEVSFSINVTEKVTRNVVPVSVVSDKSVNTDDQMAALESSSMAMLKGIKKDVDNSISTV